METQPTYETAQPPKSAIIALLQDRPIAYHPLLAKALGGVKQAVFVSQLLYWTGKGKRADGFIWKTQEEWADETGLSAGEQSGNGLSLAVFPDARHRSKERLGELG